MWTIDNCIASVHTSATTQDVPRAVQKHMGRSYILRHRVHRCRVLDESNVQERGKALFRRHVASKATRGSYLQVIDSPGSESRCGCMFPSGQQEGEKR